MKTRSFLKSFVLIYLTFTALLFAQKTLTLAVHPYLEKTELIERFTPLKNYLEKETGIKIKLKISNNYLVHIDSIGKGGTDIAFIGPEGYVTLTNIYGMPRIIGRIITDHTPYFKGLIIARKGSHIKDLKCLKKKSVAFVSRESAMGFVAPLYELLNKKISLNDFCCYDFLGSHTNVALAVLAGDFDAGMVKEETFSKYKSKGLKKIAETMRIYEHLFIARKNLDARIFEKIKRAFFKLNRPDLIGILKKIKKNITGLESAKDADYDSLRIISKFVTRSLAGR